MTKKIEITKKKKQLINHYSEIDLLLIFIMVCTLNFIKGKSKQQTKMKSS